MNGIPDIEGNGKDEERSDNESGSDDDNLA